MLTDAQMATYFREGYVILDDVIPPEQLSEVQKSYEKTIETALHLGLAGRDEASGFLQGHRFQNPHHPSLAQRALMDALGAPDIAAFARRVCQNDVAMYGIAAFAMNAEYDYLSRWHRDSYAAWGKDSPEEKRVRHIEKLPTTQIMLALEDDDCFWFVPRSHNHANTEEEEARFAEERTGWEEMFPGAVQIKLRAGAGPF
tara:strand:- start:163 stop:762 length:600 start_codon:yes stop_codon:yes gene_type:complete